MEMPDDQDPVDSNQPPGAAPGPPDREEDSGDDADGPDEAAEDGAPELPGVAAAGLESGGAVPGAAFGPAGGRRRRRRRRRGRGAMVYFTPDGQAYRLQQGADGQQAQVFLTPQ